MWQVIGHTLSMAEGDYGIRLPMTVSGVEYAAGDTLQLTIKTALNGEDLVEKTLAESEKLPPGRYVYRIDWYRDGVFLCNLVPYAAFEVVDKA